MSVSRHYPVKEGLLYRPRLDTLLNEAMKKPVTTVVAGAGYAKTSTVMHTLHSFEGKWVWFQLSRLDNFAPRFWRSFVRAVCEVYENLAEILMSLEFPSSMSKFDSFLRIFTKAIYINQEPMIIVLDDFNNIYDSDIIRFVSRLVKAEVDELSIIINSSTKEHLEVFDSYAYAITAEELKFTPEETEAYLAQIKLSLTKEKTAALYRYTEGWPLAVNLIAQGIKENKHYEQDGINIGVSTINQLFESAYFQKYEETIKKALLRLSLLQGFSAEMIKQLFEKEADFILEAVKRHMFISYDSAENFYFFQKMYQNFLNEMQFLLSEEEILQTYRIAGPCYSKNKQTLEAIFCFDACKEYDQMFREILSFSGTYFGEELTNFFIGYLDRLPESYCQKNPLADYIKASFYLNNMEIDNSYNLLKNLEQRLEGREEFKELLGEVYTSLGAVCMLRNTHGFADYYRKASECMPNGSSLKGKNMMVSCNSDALFLASQEAGALEAMEEEMHRVVPYMEKSMNGAGRGLAYLFSAEAAYQTYHLKKANEMADIAIKRASENDQYDIVCSAKFLQAKIALISGDYRQAKHQVDEITTYVNTQNIVELFDVRDCAINWFFINMEDSEQIVSWAFVDGADDRAPISRGRDSIEYANYLLYKGKYYELLAYCEQLDKMYLKRGMWIDRVRSLVIKAICYLRIGEEPRALRELHRAYEMTYKNDIITPFIEGHKHMRSLIEAARRGTEYLFDSAWLDKVYQKSSTYTKKLAAMVREYSKRDQRTDYGSIKLSKRETEVLHCLSQGLTREEIAGFQSVSVNTVKSYIRNIYNKLGAINRADAIRIASSKGLITYSESDLQ